jgi:hypothetical protein
MSGRRERGEMDGGRKRTRRRLSSVLCSRWTRVRAVG